MAVYSLDAATDLRPAPAGHDAPEDARHPDGCLIAVWNGERFVSFDEWHSSQQDWDAVCVPQETSHDGPKNNPKKRPKNLQRALDSGIHGDLF